MNRRISLLQYTNTLVRGGVEEHILVLLRGLDREMFRISFACPPALASQMRDDVPSDVELIEVPVFPLWNVSAARSFAAMLRNRGVQLLHSHMSQSSRVASPLARVGAVSGVLETTHVRESWRKTWPKSSYLPDRLFARFVDRFIAISYANAKYLTQEKGLPQRKISVVQNSCDLKRFSPTPVADPQLRRMLNIGASDPLIVVVARLEPQKGHRFLLDTLPEVVRLHPSLKVVFVGDGVLRRELAQLTDALGLAGNVAFVGFQANVPTWLATADFCVLPSEYEGLPLAALECLAAGRTMVATEVDGTPEVIEHERTGLLVHFGDTRALAQQISRLISDQKLRSRLGAAGREFVLHRFREERQIEETEQVYYDLCKARMPQELLPERFSERANRSCAKESAFA